MQLPTDEYTYGIGDRVLVGGTIGTVKGQANEEGYPDTFKIELTDDDGFKFRRWFPEHDVQKARTH